MNVPAGNNVVQANIAAVGVQPINVEVPLGRLMHLSKAKLKELGARFAQYSAGARWKISRRLFERAITYGQLENADLKFLCEKAGWLQVDVRKDVMARFLVESPYPTLAETTAANQEQQRREQRQAAAAAAAAAPPATIALAIKQLVKMAGDQPMSKEACTVKLREWGNDLLGIDKAVYHIISPAVGGVDHPRNYCVLPNYFSNDYHQSAAHAKVHHIMVLGMLTDKAVRAALDHSVGEELAGTMLAEMKAMKAAAKASGRSSAHTPRKRPRQAAPSGGDAAAAPNGADQGASDGESSNGESSDSESSDSDGPGPSQRARTENGAPAGASQVEQEAEMGADN